MKQISHISHLHCPTKTHDRGKDQRDSDNSSLKNYIIHKIEKIIYTYTINIKFVYLVKILSSNLFDLGYPP